MYERFKARCSTSVADDGTAVLGGADIKLTLGFLLNPFQSTTTDTNKCFHGNVHSFMVATS